MMYHLLLQRLLHFNLNMTVSISLIWIYLEFEQFLCMQQV